MWQKIKPLEHRPSKTLLRTLKSLLSSFRVVSKANTCSIKWKLIRKKNKGFHLECYSISFEINSILQIALNKNMQNVFKKVISTEAYSIEYGILQSIL